MIEMLLTSARIDPKKLALLHFDDDVGSSTARGEGAAGNGLLEGGGLNFSPNQGRFGGAMQFTGVAGSRVRLPINGTYRLLDKDFTIEAFVKRGSVTGSENKVLVSSGGNNTGQGGFALALLTTGRLQFYQTVSGSVALLGTSDLITANVFNHLAVTRRNGQIRGFVNGVGTAAVSYAGSFSRSDIVIGDWDAGGTPQRPFVGYIDEVRIEAQSLYWDDFTPPTAPLAL